MPPRAASFEQLGVFYLGSRFDLEKGQPGSELVLYDSKDLTTHAVCVGMTGSGKTGLCLALLEEAALDGIPALVIDPKGDLGNLLLTFSDLAPSDFRPWLDPAEAVRRGVSLDELARQTAENWKAGLAEWGQDGARIARLRGAAEVCIYTPGSEAGLPLSVLASFAPPARPAAEGGEALRDRIRGVVSGILALIQLDADPLRSREHILLSNILDRAWREGRALDLGTLIAEIQSPPFDKVGFVDLESFFPAKDRFGLAMQVNNLAATPGFATWMTGEPLDVGRLLYTAEGRPRVSILSIAHLGDAERMFFLTLLLNDVVAWMRGQSGTSSLRALLYMDELTGYLPPVANPPSKEPLLTLLKQARAFGLGVVLATQNPVDLDYKALSNAGTWFIGRLQTERDKARVLEGLEGASAAAGAAFDRSATDRILSRLGNRVFLMNNVHEDQPVVFQTRWAMSFLRGPLTREHIQALMQPRKGGLPPAAPSQMARPAAPADAATRFAASGRPVLPPGVPEVFVRRRGTLGEGQAVVYRPAILASARVHYAQAATGVDHWEERHYLASVSGWQQIDWSAEEPCATPAATDENPEKGASYEELPPALRRPKAYTEIASAIRDRLYRTSRLSTWKCAALKAASQPGESQADFRIRLANEARQIRDLEVEKLRARYAPKLAVVQERLRKAQQRVEKEKSQASGHVLSTAVSVGTTILGALFGRKLTSASGLGRAASSVRAAGRAVEERADVSQAIETVEAVQARLAELEAELAGEIERTRQSASPEALVLVEALIAPKKSEITVDKVALAWVPHRQTAHGMMEAIA
jgi:hypothetical protein